MTGPFAPIPEILDELRAGRMVVLTDDEHRENEGDLVLPAQFVTPDAVTFLLSKALGYLCLSLTEGDCDRLHLHPQASTNTSRRGTAFTVSIDLHPAHGGTTGVSAKERARCVQMAIDARYGPDDFVRPGHINPLRSRDGGVLVRAGQTEGSLDLCRLAGLYPAACIIEIMKPDGEMARLPDLREFCATHALKMCSVAQIIEHRLARESLVRRLGEPHPLRTELGEFRAVLYESRVDPLPHLVLLKGEVGPSRPTLVRMHRRNLLGDVFLDLDSTPSGASAASLHESMRMIEREGSGVIVYLRTNNREGRGESAGLEAELQTLRTPGADGDAPDLGGGAGPLREFGIGGQILRDLGLRKLRLLTNSNRSLPALEGFGLEIVERVAIANSGG